MRRTTWQNWLELMLGILLIAGGVYTLLQPGTALVGAAILYGALAVITGISDIALYIKLERRTGFAPVMALVTGILGLLAGLLLVFQPAAGAWALVWMFPVWFIAHCVSHLCRLQVLRIAMGDFYYYFSLILNIIGLIFGILMVLNPFLAANAIPCIVGCYLILLGLDAVILALSALRGRR